MFLQNSGFLFSLDVFSIYVNQVVFKSHFVSSYFSLCTVFKNAFMDFPGIPVVKNLLDNAGNMGSIPGLGRSHMPQSI